MENIYEIMRAYFNHGDPATFAVNILIDREAPRPADKYLSHEGSLHSLGNFTDSRSFILGKTKFEDIPSFGWRGPNRNGWGQDCSRGGDEWATQKP